MMRPFPAALAGVGLLLMGGVAAGGVEGLCTDAPEVESVIAGIFAEDPSCDLNGDTVVSAADLSSAVEIGALPACPEAGASIEVALDDRSGIEDATGVLNGELVEPSCWSSALARTYHCEPTAETPCELQGLRPGLWLHHFESDVTTELQVQHRKTLLVADTAPAELRFTVFASVLVVTNPANSGDGSVRNALQTAPGMAKPLLIRFDDLLFPATMPTTIALDFPLTRLETDDVTIDATDARGNVGTRVIDAQGGPFGVLSITGARNHVIGLRLRNAGEGNRDVVQISGVDAFANVLERCVIENAASGDALGIDDRAGADFDETANVVRECEIAGALDKGVKVTTGAHARIERSWIHGNANGGVQATLGGNVMTVENLIEDNLGSTAENGLVAQGFEPTVGASVLLSQGDISRRNGASGFAVRGFALGRIRDGYLAANGRSGLRVFNDVGSPAVASAAGTTVACNATDGAVISDGSRLDLGGGEVGSGGNNALTRNPLSGNGFNLRNDTTNVIDAINNQWEHCGQGQICNDAAIASFDLSDGGLETAFEPSQAHRGLGAPVVTRVSPARGAEGELLRIYGLRFNAIDGHVGEDACTDLTGSNSCSPLRGNCVRIGGVNAAVEAVTPTMLVVRWPFTCIVPVPLVVLTEGAEGTPSQPLMVCSDSSTAVDD